MGGHGRRLAPSVPTEQFSHTEVDDPKSTILAEHQLRRCQLRVGHAPLMGRVERTTCFQTDHERLRRLEQSTAIEQVTETAAPEVLDHPEHGRLTIEVDLPPIEHGADVRVGQRSRHFGASPEIALKPLGDRQFGSDDLDRDRPLLVDVDGIGDDGVRAGRDHVHDPVSPGQHAALEPAYAVDREPCCVLRHHIETLSPEQLRDMAGIMEG